jgi:opacity protein-like surface antigen
LKATICTLVFVLAASVAQAQEKGYVQGVSGVTFQSETSSLMGGEIGFNVTPDLVIYGQGGRMLNVMPKSIQNDLDLAADFLTLATGQRWAFDGKVRATYFGGGAKYLFPTKTAIRPYVLGGAGLAKLKLSVTEIDLGDVLDNLVDEGFLSDADTKANEVAYEVGGGVSVPVSVVQLDFGYRYMRIGDANISRFVGGFGVRF